MECRVALGNRLKALESNSARLRASRPPAPMPGNSRQTDWKGGTASATLPLPVLLRVDREPPALLVRIRFPPRGQAWEERSAWPRFPSLEGIRLPNRAEPGPASPSRQHYQGLKPECRDHRSTAMFRLLCPSP